MILTAEQESQWRQCGAFVVPGDCSICTTGGHDVPGGPCEYVAPAEWTALTEPCPTCDGIGHLGPATGSPQRDYGRSCPDCVNGRQIVELWVDAAPLELELISLLARVTIAQIVPANDLPLWQSWPSWNALALNAEPVPGRDWVVIATGIGEQP